MWWQKQPSIAALRKRYSKNMQQMHRRTPMPKFDFNKSYFEIPLWHGCFPVNLLHIFRTPFYENIFGGVFLWWKQCCISILFYDNWRAFYNVALCERKKQWNNRVKSKLKLFESTLIRVGFLWVRFVVGGGTKITPGLKLVRITLETWNLVRKYTHTCSFWKYTF